MEIKPQYKHSKVGLYLFNLCAKMTVFLSEHRFIYYFLSITWGFILTLFGFIVTIVLGTASIFNKKITIHPFLWVYYFKAGPTYWGGFETGLMFVRDYKSSNMYINCHEFGHTFQNCLFGPFNIFLTSIPSCLRYWYRKLTPNKKHEAYDSFWAEDAATQCGRYMYNKLMKKET